MCKFLGNIYIFACTRLIYTFCPYLYVNDILFAFRIVIVTAGGYSAKAVGARAVNGQSITNSDTAALRTIVRVVQTTGARRHAR